MHKNNNKEEKIMKNFFSTLVIILALILFMANQAGATKPGHDTNPNGFPSGEHYNLNMIGKKAEFNCPEQKYDELGNPIYGNVIFIPENGEDIRILMESGKGKKAEAITELRVTDNCTGTFDNNNEAIMQLPKNENGYRVYARALATPTGEPTINISPDLVAVEDEFGNDLYYLGLVTDDGFETEFISFTRKKGKSKAVEITGLFQWSGDVCYFETPEEGYDSEVRNCCTPGDSNGDGIIDINEYVNCREPLIDELCLLTEDDITAYCNVYSNHWVFNIADFVTYLWETNNNGVKLLQIRFYPN
jgi:hypothetical protein